MPPKPAKRRLDQALVELGLAESRARAQALILAGHVTVDGHPVTKAGTPVVEGAAVVLKTPDHPYVSRGALKLSHALDAFGLDPAGYRCLDIGASTGGFTEVLLARGAVHVTAVDVGTNQLAWKLRSEPRVAVHEQTNARDLTLERLGIAPVDLIVMDVSFISQRLILPGFPGLLVPGGQVVALIKPQFEAGPQDVGARGVVRDLQVHRRVIGEVLQAYRVHGFGIRGVVRSEPPGPHGNREFFVWTQLGVEDRDVASDIEAALAGSA
ncbi:MAG TPA: TlyA family RNA methyltransferase [bacterium]|nr:TlyA family RNA methyltransferase [bacterium]